MASAGQGTRAGQGSASKGLVILGGVRQGREPGQLRVRQGRATAGCGMARNLGVDVAGNRGTVRLPVARHGWLRQGIKVWHGSPGQGTERCGRELRLASVRHGRARSVSVRNRWAWCGRESRRDRLGRAWSVWIWQGTKVWQGSALQGRPGSSREPGLRRVRPGAASSGTAWCGKESRLGLAHARLGEVCLGREPGQRAVRMG